MMEFILSKKPLQNNANCAHCGKVFNDKGISLRIQMDHRVIDFPICQPCFEIIPRFQATINWETGYARLKR